MGFFLNDSARLMGHKLNTAGLPLCVSKLWLQYQRYLNVFGWFYNQVSLQLCNRALSPSVLIELILMSHYVGPLLVQPNTSMTCQEISNSP